MKGPSLIQTLTATLASRLRRVVIISSQIEAYSKEGQLKMLWLIKLSFTVHESDVFIDSALCPFSRFNLWKA